MNESDDPTEDLADGIRNVLKACVDFVIDEAMESKAEFAVKMDKEEKNDKHD